MVPERLRGFLDEHQIDGTAKAIEALDKHGGFLLADGTGVGKSRQMIAVAKTFADKGKKVLIVTKSGAIKPDWNKEKFSGSFLNDSQAMGVNLKLNKGDDSIGLGEIHLSTYDRLSKLKDKIDKDTLIIHDESHSLKNWQSARSKHGYEMNKAAGQVMYASATPLDKPTNLAYLFRAKIFGLGSWDDTYKKLGLVQKEIHIGGGRTIKKWEINPKVGASEVYRRLAGLFDKMTEEGLMVKREISFDGVEMSVNNVELPAEAHETLKRIDAEVAAKTSNPGLRKALSLMHQRRQLEPYKIPHAVSQAQKDLAEGRQAVIFLSRVNESEVLGMDDEEGEEEVIASSEGTAKSLREALEKAGITEIAEIHGGAKEKPQKGMDDFQSGRAKVVIATVESGGTGINLDDTVGDRPRSLIMMTAPFSAVENVQAAGRVWRLKTKSSPRLHYLFSDTDVDRWNAGLISTKMKTLGAVVQGETERLDISKLPSERLQAEAVEMEPKERYRWESPLTRTPSPVAPKPAPSEIKPGETAENIKPAEPPKPIVVSGNTYEHREAIKAAGGRYDGDRKIWRVPADSIQRIENLSGLEIEGRSKLAGEKPSKYVVTGNTYPNKDAIKAAGGRWDSARTAWVIPAASKDKLEKLSGLRFSEEKRLLMWLRKDLSWLDSNLGGALVKPPATKLPPSALFRNRLALAPEEAKALRAKHRRKGMMEDYGNADDRLRLIESIISKLGTEYQPRKMDEDERRQYLSSLSRGIEQGLRAGGYDPGAYQGAFSQWISKQRLVFLGRKALNDDAKGIGSTIESAGRWLSAKWESLESRYGRRAALGMAIAAVTTFPLPGNIAAIIAAAEAIRGIHGYFSAGLYGNFVPMNGSKALPPQVGESSIRGKPCEQGQAASRTGCIPAEPSEGGPTKKPEEKPKQEPKRAAPGSQLSGEQKDRLRSLGMVGTFPPADVPLDAIKMSQGTAEELKFKPLMQWDQKTKSGRISRQYRYTQEFHDRNAAAKFDRVVKVEPHLDKAKQVLAKRMSKGDDAAAIASIIAETGLRPTDGADSVKHRHYGIASLLAKHAKIKGEEIYLDFIGKEGVRNKTVIRDPVNVDYLKEKLANRTGNEPLWDAGSDKAGDALKEAVKEAGGPDDVKLKDLRTIKAIQTARQVVKRFKGPPPPLSGNEKKDAKAIVKAILTMSGEVAKVLNNTPTQARDNYIHPEVFSSWQKKLTA